MFHARLKRQNLGVTWVEVLVTLAILGVLLASGMSHWRGLQAQHAERRLFHDLGHILAFARNQAFLRAETLVLLPRVASEGWSSGMVLVFQNTTLEAHAQPLHTWRWRYPNVHLSWHGFLGEDTIIIAHNPAKIAMNGSFLIKINHLEQKRWVVNRLGRIRVLRKHVD